MISTILAKPTHDKPIPFGSIGTIPPVQPIWRRAEIERMPRFRQHTPSGSTENLGGPAARALLADVFRPLNFFVSGSLELHWSDWVHEEIPWEIFNGRLLDSAHTRERRCFEALQLHRTTAQGLSSEPLLSIKYDPSANQVHIVRGVECFVNEAYDAGDNVILTRETRKWVRELIGTVDLSQFTDPVELRDELICRLFQAVVGTSRLPLTSVEAPLPEFSLGELTYVYRANAAAGDGPMRRWRDLLPMMGSVEIASLEQAKLLEMLVRATPAAELGDLALALSDRLRVLRDERRLPGLLRTMFNEVSLTPYTDFVPKTLEFLHHLVRCKGLTVEQHVDFLGYLLRQLGRHLTAYDLVTYHHRGANYPDALLLDAALKDYLRLIERHPELFLTAGSAQPPTAQRMRRRALRQAWYFRRHYEGHLVPNVPTSPGENNRCLPPPHQRIPDDQILDSTKRTRRLYDGDPIQSYLTGIGREVLQQSVRDFHDPLELRELGMATFLDRPLGRWKRPGEPDQTPLLSYDAYSRSIAHVRLVEISRVAEFDYLDWQAMERHFEVLRVDGINVDAASSTRTPGRVSIADVWEVASDFVLLRTTKQSACEFLNLFDWSPLNAAELPILNIQVSLIIGALTEPHLSFFDDQMRRLIELRFDPASPFQSRGGVEFPTTGLQITHILTAEGVVWREHNVDFRIQPLVAR